MDWPGIIDGVVASLLIIGGAAVIGWVKTRWPKYGDGLLTAVLAAAAFTVIIFTVTGRAIFSKQQPETTPENVDANIRIWCDYWGFGVQKESNPGFYFVDLITIPTQQIKFRISRSKERDHYLQFESSFPLSQEQLSTFAKLPKNRQMHIRNEISLEMGRAKTSYIFVQNPSDSPLQFQGLLLQQLVPITASLNQDTFTLDVNDIDSATTVAARSLVLALEQN